MLIKISFKIAIINNIYPYYAIVIVIEKKREGEREIFDYNNHVYNINKKLYIYFNINN